MNFTDSELSSQFCARAYSHVILISQSWPRMCSRVHLNFAVVIFQIFILLYFLAVFEILGQPCAVFGVLSLVSSLFSAIMIRRLLYVEDYEVSSLNSS